MISDREACKTSEVHGSGIQPSKTGENARPTRETCVWSRVFLNLVAFSWPLDQGGRPKSVQLTVAGMHTKIQMAGRFYRCLRTEIFIPYFSDLCVLFVSFLQPVQHLHATNLQDLWQKWTLFCSSGFEMALKWLSCMILRLKKVFLSL